VEGAFVQVRSEDRFGVARPKIFVKSVVDPGGSGKHEKSVRGTEPISFVLFFPTMMRGVRFGETEGEGLSAFIELKQHRENAETAVLKRKDGTALG